MEVWLGVAEVVVSWDEMRKVALSLLRSLRALENFNLGFPPNRWRRLAGRP